ncbi:hypothetical protein M426DRAFT_322237 [Hypoxylon sp. CI-4A]|nr:hypothetical protein M426DRAFT_322237 [Hypoxylon sp. CI-4A]
MADPLTILGAAAASFQFAGYAIKGLLQAIELAEAAQNAPKRMIQLLHHIDREVASVNTLLSSDSPVFHHLSVMQYARISVSAIEARKAMEEIQRDLWPLADICENTSKPDERGRRIIKMWKSLMSIKKEKDLEVKLKFLEKLNASLLRELQISGIEMQSTLCKQGGQILTNISASAADIQGETATLARSIDSLRHGATESSASHDRNLASVRQSLDQVEANLNTLRQDISNNSVLSSSEIQAQVSDHQLKITSLLQARADDAMVLIRAQAIEDRTTLLQNIRKELKDVFSDSMEMHPYSRNGGSPDMRDSIFEIDIGRGTARLEVSDDLRQLSTRSNDYVKPHKPFKSWRCRCKAGIARTTWAYGRLGFRVQTQAAHYRHVHRNKQAWSWSIEAKLSPFLKGTLDLTFGLLKEGREWKMSPSLAFRCTVKRDESPIFRLFDDFVETYAIIDDTKDEYGHVRSCRHNETYFCYDEGRDFPLIVYLTWDDETMMEGFSRLVRQIEESIESGQASGADMDEDGRTLLTSTFHLVTLLGLKSEHVAGELNSLIQIAYVSDVDPMAISHPAHEKYRFEYFPQFDHPVTAMQYLLRYLTYHDPTPIHFFDSVKEYDGLFESLGDFSRNSSNAELRLLLTRPEIAEALGYSDLCIAIIRRSLPGLRRLYTTKEVEGQATRLSPIELTIGWPEGLRFFVGRGHDVAEAFVLACWEKDEDSASILLTADDIFCYPEPQHVPPCLEVARCYEPIFRMVAEELRRRRETLKEHALNYLSREERDKMGISKTWALDENAAEVYRLLERMINVPKRLNCLMGTSPHCSDALYSHDYSVYYHKILYDVGFTNLNVPCMHGVTPLAEYCEMHAYKLDTRVPGDDRGLPQRGNDGLLWFLEKGACPDFRAQDGSSQYWPHILFYLALMVGYGKVDKRAANLFEYQSVTDNCKCFCSSDGCTPSFMLWRCNGSYRFAFHHLSHCTKRHHHRFENLRRWTNIRKLSRAQKERDYRDICRLELFERLGMRHTCCNSDSLTAEEKHELRSEDALSAQQLKQLLRLYARTRKLFYSYPIEVFWKIWWKTIDIILPPLLPKEACRSIYWKIDESTLDRRQDRWAAQLSAAGYSGIEFGEVIKYHFAKFLLLAKMLMERSNSWRRRRWITRLMAKALN